MEILKYKGFEGSAELDMARNVCHGRILYIDDAVTYQSASIEGLQKEFEDAVEDYLVTCIEIGKEPQKPCRGQFNVRISSELHREAVRRANADGTSLNDVVFKALESYLHASPFGAVTRVRLDTGVEDIYQAKVNFVTKITDLKVLGGTRFYSAEKPLVQALLHEQAFEDDKLWGETSSAADVYLTPMEVDNVRH